MPYPYSAGCAGPSGIASAQSCARGTPHCANCPLCRDYLLVCKDEDILEQISKTKDSCADLLAQWECKVEDMATIEAGLRNMCDIRVRLRSCACAGGGGGGGWPAGWSAGRAAAPSRAPGWPIRGGGGAPTSGHHRLPGASPPKRTWACHAFQAPCLALHANLHLNLQSCSLGSSG